MLSFVRWYGEIPPEARRIEDFEANDHAAFWVRRNLGLGIAYAYVIGFQADVRWWTLFFDRIEGDPDTDQEVWKVESYSNSSPAWVGRFHYCPSRADWRHVEATAPGESPLSSST